jgi:RNA polymerase sigma factor (sigma-70 family)
MATAQLNSVVRYVHKLAAGNGSLARTDRQLLADFTARRDEAAFAALVARHGSMVLRVCRRALKHEQDAEDAFQATFLILARKSTTIRKPEALAEWLHGVAYRTALEVKRSAARRRGQEARLWTMMQKAAVSPTWDDVQAVLDEEIQRLREPYRVAFVLCVLEGKSGPQAAAELGVKEGTVCSRLGRARQLLQQRLARRGIQLAAVLAALSVMESAGEASVSATLAQTTLRFGLLVAAGDSAAGVVPSHIAALAAGVTRAMFVTKTKIAIALLLAGGLFAAGAGAMAHQALSPKNSETPAIAKSEPPANRDDTTPQTTKDSGEIKEAVTFSGRVVNPEGRPVPGAKLHLIAQSWASGKPVHVETKSGADGSFHLAVAPSEARRLADEPPWSRTYVLAMADGFGPAVSLREALESAGDLTLRLAKDDVPITGRILDLQGKPIAGVQVRVEELCMPSTGDLTPWLDALQANKLDGMAIQHRFLESVHVPPSANVFPAVVTDEQGRFQIRGVGRERVVGITIEGPTIMRSHMGAAIRVRTRPGKPIRAAMYSRNPEGGQVTYYGAEFDHTAAPTRPIIGVVRDKDTGKPIPGVAIQSNQFAGVNASGDSCVHTVTDKEGRYRLVGMPKAAGNSIKVAPAVGQPYLQSVREVADVSGLEPVTVDFDLKRGVLVKGRVLDQATGKPVFANVQYLAFADNPRHKNVPAWTVENYLQTGADGSYEVVALPGRGLLTARGWSDHYRMGVGADKFAKKDRYGNNDEFLLTAPHLCHPTTVHTLVEIDPAEHVESLTQDILLDPGTMPRGTITGPDGKPLTGTEVLGLTAYARSQQWTHVPLKHAEFTVYGLDAREERQLVFIHAAKHLAAALKVRGDDKGPLAVRLEPWGIVTGRLVTEDGKPRPGVLLQISEGSLPNAEYQTDAEGRFRIEGLVPQVAYALEIMRNGKPAGRVFADLKLKAAEARNLGDLHVKPTE